MTNRTRLPLPEPHHWLYHNKTGVSVVHWSKQQPRWLADKSAASAFPDAHWFFDSFTADQMRDYAAAEPDCRTCMQFVIRSHGCGSIGVCVDGNSYVALPPVRLWENTK